MIYKLLKFAWFLPVLLMAGCIKENKKTFTDFSKVQDYIILVNSGLANLSASTLQVDATSPDTLKVDVWVDLAGVYSATADIPVTLFIDNAQIGPYNAANGSNFLPFTADMYKITSMQPTILKGQHFVKIVLSVIQNKVDPSKSWMLPLSIKDASGKLLTTNLNTLFFNIIGNPLAGPYHWDFTRWNNSDASGPPTGSSFVGRTTTFVPATPTTVEVPSGYFIQPRYAISFTNNAGVLSNFTVKIDDADMAALIAGGVTVISGPNILIADPVNRKFKFQYVVFNGAAFRYIIDYYYP